MNITLLITVIAFLLTPLALGLLVGKRTGLAATAILILLPLSGFFVFGFLASGELSPEDALP